MKIAIINVSGRMSSDGSRLISALLKQAGHSAKSVFLARPEPLTYEQEELAQLDDILRNTDIVMIAVYSSYAIRAVQVTEFIRKKYPGMKVIWGGPHCISMPELSLRYADAVCFSEGDQVAAELVNRIEARGDYLDTPNMAFNVEGETIANQVLPPFSDLDTLPYYDYNLDDQFLLDRRIYQMTKEILRERLSEYYPYYVIPILYVVTSRGCPHRCSFCNNCRYIAMFGRNELRFQSVDRVIDELEHTLNYLGFIEFLGFADDDFFIRSLKDLEDFAEKYKRRVGLPFGVAVSPNTFSKEKIEILLDAGLKAIQMGVQSGSQRVLDEIYNRRIQIPKTMNVVYQIESYRQTLDLDFLLDFIIDNPYETRDDIIQTYRFLLETPSGVRINIFLLAFFPGTPIYDRALGDGIIESFSEKTFRFYTRSRIRYQKNYETFLVLLLRSVRRHSLLRKYIPRFVFRILVSRPVRGFAAILPERFYALLCKSVQ